MPGPSVGIDSWIGHRCQRGVCRSPVLGRGGPVDGRTHQRMPEPHVHAELQQAGVRGQVDVCGVQAEDVSPAEKHGRVPDRIGGREQDQPLRLLRQLTEALQVLDLDAAGQVSRVRKREPAGQFGGTQAAAELEQGKRIAVRLLDDPGPDALVERAGRDRRQQRTSRLFSQPAQPEFGQAGQVIRRGDCVGSRGRRPDREHQRDRLGKQAAPDEPEDLSRGLVEPLCVIHDAQQRLLLGRLRHQAERPEGDQEPVGVVSRGKPERDTEPVSLGLGERTKPAEHRSAQLVQPGEGKLHLRLDTGRADHVETGRLPDQVTQQGRLADPRFTPDHQDGALAASHVAHELLQDLQLTGPAEQPGRGRRGHVERSGRPVRGTYVDFIGGANDTFGRWSTMPPLPAAGPKARGPLQLTLAAASGGSQRPRRQVAGRCLGHVLAWTQTRAMAGAPCPDAAGRATVDPGNPEPEEE